MQNNNNTGAVLTKEWYLSLENQTNRSFINLPIEFQVRGYDYEFISNSYLNFFKSGKNTRQDKLTLAKKFLKFIRSINKNRAKEELTEKFFEVFNYFMENFPDLLCKQDLIHLETLDVLTAAIDKSQFIEDIISVDELHRRVKRLESTQHREKEIQDEWGEFEIEYRLLNPGS